MKKKLITSMLIITILSSYILPIPNIKATSGDAGSTRGIVTEEWQYNYTGNEQTFTAPVTAVYEMIVAGAQGNNGAKGAIVTGSKVLKAGERINIYVGGQNGYNGGGSSTSNSRTQTLYKFSHYCRDGTAYNSEDPVNYTVTSTSYNGGGATDIRFNGNSKEDRIIVAGGGAGGAAGTGYSNTGSATPVSNNTYLTR